MRMFRQVGNQDHSLMLGVEAADNILFGAKACPFMALTEPGLTSTTQCGCFPN